MSELGLRLKSAREEKGYTLEELQQITKIQKRYILAIEDGDFSKMPGDFYGRAFVKSYSEAVGLDPNMVFEEHKDELPQPKREPTDLPPRVNRSKPQTVRKKSKLASLLPTIVVVLFILAIAAVAWGMGINNGEDSTGISREDQQGSPGVDLTEPLEDENNNEENTEESNETDEDNNGENNNGNNDNDGNEEENEANEEEEASFELEESEGETSRFTLTNTDTFNLSMEFSGATWIRITDNDGGTIHEQEHADGDEINFDFSDEDEILIRVGSTVTSALFVNGEEVEYPLDQTTQNILIEFNN
ncbi:helix-turn-helix domain-containing protein [Salipaludibacillus daqingensis]|uniref:helix-turn-helix domain-containing protein n=1 Tax=Salipaludibacillus daqingensis TaxID=3041001 RepID=UPI0024759DDD|nr:RodZ domain-containing protein [Salipaludibacillus daqingensis]